MLSLKSFKHVAAMSEETLCFHAKVCWNGKIVGETQNTGHGGATEVRLNAAWAKNPELLTEARRIAAEGVLGEYLPEPDKDPEGWAALEYAVDTLVQDILEAKEKASLIRWETKNAKAWAAGGLPFAAFWTVGDKRSGKAWRTAEARTARMAHLAAEVGIPFTEVRTYDAEGAPKVAVNA